MSKLTKLGFYGIKHFISMCIPFEKLKLPKLCGKAITQTASNLETTKKMKAAVRFSIAIMTSKLAVRLCCF